MSFRYYPFDSFDLLVGAGRCTTRGTLHCPGLERAAHHPTVPTMLAPPPG